MKVLHFWLFVASLFLSPCVADLLDYASQIPACGLTCLIHTIPASECLTFTNNTCICNSDSLRAATDDCMSANCTILERLAVAKLDAQACNKTVEYRRVYDWIGMGILDALGPFCFTLRLWARWAMTERMDVDDWVMVVAFIVWLPFTILGVILRIEAIGYNIWDLDIPTITRALKLFFIDELLYTLTLALLRVSILFFYMKVFAPLTKWCWATMAFVVVSALVIIFLTMFQCIPINYNWDGWSGDFSGSYHCLDLNALSYAAATSGILQDIIILVLPLPTIATLQMKLRRKILTIVIFSFGVFIIITSCIRLKSLVQFTKSLNPTWDYVDAVLWTSLEVNISVAIVCLPAVRAYLQSKFATIFGSVTSQASKTGGSSIGNSVPRRNEYADLPDHSASKTTSAFNAWEQTSIELETANGSPPASLNASEGDTAPISTGGQNTNSDAQRPKRASLAFSNRKKVGSSQV